MMNSSSIDNKMTNKMMNYRKSNSNKINISGRSSGNTDFQEIEFKNDKGEYDFENPEIVELVYNDVYTEYEPSRLTFGAAHPYSVVESRSLTNMSAPEITYQLKLPDAAISNGVISRVQLESIIYACQKHEDLLSDGCRAGFLIGDGAGVGKGRTVAAIIMENYLRGRKKSIWISVSGDLRLDAVRDLVDVGREIGVEIPLRPLNKMKYSQIGSSANDSFQEGVLFVTYSSLISSTKRKQKKYTTFEKRIDQIIDWFGADYDGVVVFDESHKAKNLVHDAGMSTKTGKFVKQLQDSLRSARVVYASATGATEPQHMAYMTRLGLWGPGNPFETFDEFKAVLTRHGLAAMELMAIEMKMKGIYMARKLGFVGIKFEIQTLAIRDSVINGHRFDRVYDRCVDLWARVRHEFEVAFTRNHFNPKVKLAFYAQFWGSHQRFFKYLCMSGKLDKCVAIVEKQLAAQKCVIIGLQSTGEANTLGALEDCPDGLDDFVSSARAVIRNLIENFYPSEENIRRFQKSHVNKKSIPESTVDDLIKQKLLDLVEKIDDMLPTNVLDNLIHRLGGPDKVAEITGRKGRMVSRNGVVSYESRKESGRSLDQINIIEKNRFNNGEKLIGIISDAASTGISLHSDRRFKNRLQRVHITIELPWSADKAIQQFGRTHRSNQEVPPHYLFLISDLAGEIRFASTVARRLESLGALTHGDRRCADTTDLNQFNLDNKFGVQSARDLITAIFGSGTLNVPYPIEFLSKFNNDWNNFTSKAQHSLLQVGLGNSKNVSVPRFLNRLLGISLDIQDALFRFFLHISDCKLQDAKSRNEFDHGIRDAANSRDSFYLEQTQTLRYRSTVDRRNNDDIIIHKVRCVSKCLHEISLGHYANDNCRYGKRTKFIYIITGAVFFAWKLISAVYENVKLEIIRVELQDSTKIIGALVYSGYIEPFRRILLHNCDDMAQPLGNTID